MAASDIVTAAKQVFFNGDIAYRRAVSESILTKVASAINYITTRIYLNEKVFIGGFFNANSFDNGSGGIIRIRRQSVIDEYSLYFTFVGSSGTNAINFNIFDSSGTLINTLFDTGTLSVSGSGGQNVIIGREEIQATPNTFEANTTGHTVTFGTLNETQLEAGWYLVPFVESNGSSAYNMTFNLKIQEL